MVNKVKSESIASPRVLILGGPSSGKTTYRTQLYQRIEHSKGELQLKKSVSDMTSLDGDVERLIQGLQPMHSMSDSYHSTTFFLENREKQQLLLEFADYGGEQIQRIATSNVLSNTWIERIQAADSWLFFLRIDPVRTSKSFMTEHVEIGPLPDGVIQHKLSEPSSELEAVEMLQRLLFVRGLNLRYPVSNPTLGVLLSCWDELADIERARAPDKVLANRAPMLSNFLAANWAPNSIQMWGLSSTERKLPEREPDLEFAQRGPEHFGYVIDKNGHSNTDLTIPINWLFNSGRK